MENLFWVDSSGGIYEGDRVEATDVLATQDQIDVWNAHNANVTASQISVTAYQAVAALAMAQQVGITNFDVLAATTAAVDKSNNPLVAIAWEKTTTFTRSSPLMLSVGAAVGLTGDQISQIFDLALTITA